MFGALLLTLVADQALAQTCVGAQPAICPLGQPSDQDCRIDADCTVGSSAPYPQLDFGTRRLVVTRTITVNGDGILRVKAGAVALEGSGTIRAQGAGQGAQRVELLATGDVTVASSAAIDVSSSAGSLTTLGSGGNIDLAGAAVRIDGKLSADGIGMDTYGGYVTVDAAGDLRVADVDVRGGQRAGGGDVSFYAGGTITASKAIRAQGWDGGSVGFDAGGDIVTLSEILVQATAADGYGGGVDAYAIGSVTIGGAVSGWGQEGAHDGGPAESGGDGADVTIDALEGSVAINANVDLSGAPSGYGGDLEVAADLDVVINGKISLGTEGILGSGSIGTDITAGRNLTIGKDIDATCPGYGGELVFDVGGTLTILSKIRVDGASDPFDGVAGSITIQGGCELEIAAGAVLSALGAGDFPYASNDVRAASITIGGTLQASSENLLDYASLTLQPTANLIPAAPLPGPSPTAPCCGGCATTTTTSTLPPTTTTSTLPPTTTTSTLPPTTTSTTLPPTTTTTTTSVPTSSSTTVSSTTTLASTTSTSATSSTTLTTTTEPAVTSTTVATSTTTTTGEPGSTTSTTAPPPGAECLERPSAADAASCRIDALADTLGASPIDDLGGKATARRLNALLGRANRFLTSAESGANVKVNLRKARRQLKSFERAVKQGLKRKRSTIDAVLGEFILGLATDATNDVGVMQAKLR